MLYCFVSHNQAVLRDRQHITNMMSGLSINDYKIFYGGNNLNISDENVVHLKCIDTYEGLPNKIHNICKYLIERGLTNNFSHFCKVDGTTILQKPFPILEYDYYGYVCPETNPPEYRRLYHINKCSKNSDWNKKKYNGDFVPYCAGGFCYVLSSKAVKCISENPDNANQDIYEDLYVGQKLFDYNIMPHHINTTKYFKYY